MGVRAQPGKALAAASAARAASSRPPDGNTATTSSRRAGFRSGFVVPAAAAVHCPPIRFRYSRSIHSPSLARSYRITSCFPVAADPWFTRLTVDKVGTTVSPAMSSEFPTRTSSVTSPVLRSSDTDHARFPSGVVLANRYRIVALAGRGGMGEVYRADDLKLGQVVALKFLPLAVATDPSKLARLFAEARLAREVTHPNVCRVHDVGEVDGQHFLTMEYVDGEDLAS